MPNSDFRIGDYVHVPQCKYVGRLVDYAEGTSSESKCPLFLIDVSLLDNEDDYIVDGLADYQICSPQYMEKIKKPSFEIGQHLLYSNDGECAVTVVRRRFDTHFNCWMYQFAEGGAFFSEDDCFSSFPSPWFKSGEHVTLRDNTSPYTTEGIIIKPSTFRGQPSYNVEVVETREVFNWLASDILPLNNDNNSSMQEEKFNIGKYLSGHEGEEFFSPNLGPLKYKGVNAYNSNQLLFFDKKSELVKVRKNSIINPLTGLASLYPSKESFASDCFHPRELWDKWADEQLVYGVVINIATYKNQDEIEDGQQSFSRRFRTETEMNDFIDKLTININSKTK